MLIERQYRTRQPGQPGQPDQSSQWGQAGFTLVELMVVVAVVGILAIVAAPAMSALVSANRLSGAAEGLTASMQLARSEAVRRNTRVTVCGSADGTTCAASTNWVRWIVRGRDNTLGVDEVMRDDTPAGNVNVSGPATGVIFRPSGLLDAQTSVTACLPVTNPALNQRVITVMISGVVSAKPTDGGGTCP